MRLLLLLVVLGLGVAAQAQDVCRMGVYGSSSLVPGYGPTPDASLFPASEVGVTRTVPVFFHLIQSTGNQSPLNLTTLRQQVALLNTRYATPPGGAGWTAPRYQFTLAGADRVVNDTWAGEGVEPDRPATSGEFAMKELLAVDPARVLNGVRRSGDRAGHGQRTGFPSNANRLSSQRVCALPFPVQLWGGAGAIPGRCRPISPVRQPLGHLA